MYFNLRVLHSKRKVERFWIEWRQTFHEFNLFLIGFQAVCSETVLETLKADSHIPYRAPAVLRQCHVLRESPRVASKIRTANREILRGSRKKPTEVDRPQTVQRHTIPCPLPCCAVALTSRLQSGIIEARQGHGPPCANQTRSHCVIQTGKTRFQSIATRHGMRELALRCI